MRYAEPFTSTPDGWESPGEDLLGHAQETAMAALHDERVVGRLAAYYSRGGNFAGATFIKVGPQEPYAFNEADLLALTLLKVAVGPAAVRRLLEPSRTRGNLIDLLGERYLPVDADIALADAGTLVAMEGFHVALKQAISPTESRTANPWVTASKLSARKRPDLFPVRDSVVCRALGLQEPKQNYQVDWLVYRALTQDGQIRVRLDQVIDEAARHPGVDVGRKVSRLRHLDVVLWMHHRKGAGSLSADVSDPK